MNPETCDGYGTDLHPAFGLIEVRAPLPMALCEPCWQRWRNVNELPEWSTQ